MKLKNLLGMHKIDLEKARKKLPKEANHLEEKLLLGLLMWGINARAGKIDKATPDFKNRTAIYIPTEYLRQTFSLVGAWHISQGAEKLPDQEIILWHIVPLKTEFALLPDNHTDDWQSIFDGLGWFLQNLPTDSK